MIDLRKGDCLEEMDKLMADGVKVDLILTDPPYGTTRCSWDSIINLSEMWKRLNLLIKDNGAIVLFGQEPFSSKLRMSNVENYRYDWCWIKDSATGFLNSHKMPMKIFENILIFYKELPNYNPQMRKGFEPYSCKQGKTLSNVYDKMPGDFVSKSDNGERFPIDVLEFKRDWNHFHPNQKPVALLEYLIKTYTKENETVLDFTMGSGSTGVACKNLNRNFIGIEKDDKYFDIAKQRIENGYVQESKEEIEEFLDSSLLFQS